MSISTREPSTDTQTRIAIVGCGPKGLYALERLTIELDRLPTAVAGDITIFEPAEFPGAGHVYDPKQPHYLRMNFAVGLIDAWSEPASRRAKTELDLLRWLEQHHPRFADAESFAPRALVGEYLYACFLQVLAQLRRHAHVTVVRSRVDDVVPCQRGWRVAVGNSGRNYDEVLLTVGHEGWRPAASPSGDNGGQEISHVFPVDRQLTEDRIAARSTVAIRGFGLTGIDAILALTEGRKGRFDQRDDRWSYRPSGREPRCILPFSRSGRPMLAKPQPSRMGLSADPAEIVEPYRRQLLQRRRPQAGFNFSQELWPLVLAAAEAVLNANGGTDVRCWWQAWNTASGSPSRTREVMQASYRVAVGRRRPDAAWASGQTWRQLYPALVQRISHGGLHPDSWREFRRIAAEMERIAFGPPAENVGRLLGLIDHGLLDLRFVAQAGKQPGPSPFAGGRDKKRFPYDRLVHAVLPSSHQWNQQAPLSKLLAAGIVCRAAGAEGIMIDRSGRPLDADGHPRPGLAVLGRPTEGVVLGNDTLSRTLHRHPDCWADAIARRLLAARTKPPW